MKNYKYFKISYLIILFPLFFLFGCNNKADEKAVFMKTLEDYENAWAAGDFLKVESFFADSAKRLHTEPYVWDRKEIKRYFLERAKQESDNTKPFVKNAWKKERKYLEIRVEGNIAYDVFTTEKFKALHIWGKQKDGSWKILYDVGMLNYPEKN